jgi:hypothetical protein
MIIMMDELTSLSNWNAKLYIFNYQPIIKI